MVAPYPSKTPYWTASNLEALRADLVAGYTLTEAAARQPGEMHSGDCDRALWALVGRSTEQALYHLNRRAAA